MRTSLFAGGSVLAAVAATIVACSSSSDPSPTSIPSGASSGGQSNAGTLAPHAHTVQSAPMAMDDASITFADNAETEALAPGDTIVSATRTDAPYLRTIESAAIANGQVTFTTTDAALTDLFSSLHISQVIALDDPDNATGNSALTSGLTGTGDDAGGDDAGTSADAMPGDDDAGTSDAGDDAAASEPDAQPKSPGAHPLYLHPLDQTVTPGTFSPGGNARISPSVGISIDASESYVKVSGGVQFDYDYDSIFNPAPTSMTLALNGALAVHIGGEVTGKAGVSYRTAAVSWASPTIAVLWFQVGVVPVPVVVTLDLATQFFGQFKGDIRFHTGTTMTFALQEGVQYKDGALSPLNTQTFSKVDEPFMLEGGGANLDLSFYPAITTLYMKPFKVVGPFVQLKPVLEVECNEFTGTAPNTSSVQFYGDVGVQPTLGGDVNVFGFQKTVGPFNLPKIDKHYLLGTIAEACAVPQTGPKGVQYCNESALRSCLSAGPTNNGCAKQAQTSATGTICGAPANQDVSCDFDQLLPCLCNAASGTSTSSSSSDGGDCYAQHCVACSKSTLVCPVPDGTPLASGSN
jgi:hypothetical protein